MNHRMIRHGDVYLIPTADKPRGDTRKDRVVALGEATGHRHEIVGGALYDEPGGGLLLVPDAETEIHHRKGEAWTGEHTDIKIPEGTNYKVRVQRQWEPEGWSYVAD